MKHHLRLRLLSSFAKLHSAQRNTEAAMNLEYSAAEKSFRDEIRIFIRKNLPESVATKVLEHKRLSREAREALHAHPWPGNVRELQNEIGASGCCRAAHLRRGVHGRGRRPSSRSACAWSPVIMKYGPPRSSSSTCRASSRANTAVPGLHRAWRGLRPRLLKTTAVRRGDTYVVNGRRRGTRWAISRTGCSASRERPAGPLAGGHSFLLIDMKSKGISVRPIALIDGNTR